MSFEQPAVEADVRHRLGTLRLKAAFRATAPWTMLFGPSGSGKSTILRAIAGLVRPEGGRVCLLGQTVADEFTWVPAHLRPVRWSGQREALFPGKTVRENVALALGPKADRQLLDVALSEFGLLELGGKRPGELSGGQRQLISVVRAAAGAQGKVLLLDEPFAGLDQALRDNLIAALRRFRGDAPVISVTHDVGEAFLLGADVVRVSEGRVVGQGPAAEVLGAERERLRGVLQGG